MNPINRNANVVSPPGREPMLRLLLEDLDRHTSETENLLNELAGRLEPILEVLPPMPPPAPSHLGSEPQRVLPQALQMVSNNLARVKRLNGQLIDLRGRLEV